MPTGRATLRSGMERPVTALKFPIKKSAYLQYGRKHENEIFRLSPTVEEQARKKENGILRTVGNNEIHEQNARQESVQKRYT